MEYFFSAHIIILSVKFYVIEKKKHQQKQHNYNGKDSVMRLKYILYCKKLLYIFLWDHSAPGWHLKEVTSHI